MLLLLDSIAEARRAPILLKHPWSETGLSTSGDHTGTTNTAASWAMAEFAAILVIVLAVV